MQRLEPATVRASPEEQSEKPLGETNLARNLYLYYWIHYYGSAKRSIPICHGSDTKDLNLGAAKHTKKYDGRCETIRA